MQIILKVVQSFLNMTADIVILKVHFDMDLLEGSLMNLHSGLNVFRNLLCSVSQITVVIILTFYLEFYDYCIVSSKFQVCMP